MASGVVDACLIPEIDISLKALTAFVSSVLDRKGHCVLCVAEGACQELMAADGGVSTDGALRRAARPAGPGREGPVLLFWRGRTAAGGALSHPPPATPPLSLPLSVSPARLPQPSTPTPPQTQPAATWCCGMWAPTCGT